MKIKLKDCIEKHSFLYGEMDDFTIIKEWVKENNVETELIELNNNILKEYNEKIENEKRKNKTWCYYAFVTFIQTDLNTTEKINAFRLAYMSFNEESFAKAVDTLGITEDEFICIKSLHPDIYEIYLKNKQ